MCGIIFFANSGNDQQKRFKGTARFILKLCIMFLKLIFYGASYLQDLCY